MKNKTARELFLHYLKKEIDFDEKAIKDDFLDNKRLQIIKGRFKDFLPYFLFRFLRYNYYFIKKLFSFRNKRIENYNRRWGFFDKAFAIDFVEYIFSNPEIDLDLDIFDEKSKMLADRFIGNRVRLAFNENVSSGELFDMQEYIRYKKEYSKLNSKIKKVKDGFVLEHNDKKYLLPIDHFEIPIFFHDYGLSNLPSSVTKNINKGSVLDIGAYVGDSALKFLEYSPHKVICLEPEKKNFTFLQKTVNLNKIQEKVDIFNIGAGEKEEKLFIDYLKSASYISDRGRGDVINIHKVDDIIRNKKISLIKVDVEGFEYEVIKGALGVIKRDRPILIIAVYHRGKDFFKIPSLLKNNLSDYKYELLDLHKTSPICEKFLLAYSVKT